MNRGIYRPEFIEKRSASRINIEGYEVLIESVFQKENIYIENITSMGFFGKSRTIIRSDQKILVHFPVIGAVLAEILWQKTLSFGARFCEPIPNNLFEKLIDQLWHQPADVA
jgi:hypothetical protein